MNQHLPGNFPKDSRRMKFDVRYLHLALFAGNIIRYRALDRSVVANHTALMESIPVNDKSVLLTFRSTVQNRGPRRFQGSGQI